MKRKTTPWWRTELGFPTKKGVEEKIRGIVKSYPVNKPISKEDEAFMLKVFSHHYKHAEKVGCGLAHMEIRLNPSWNGATLGFWFVRTDGSEIDTSWVVALQPEGRPTAKREVADAARYEVYPQIHAHHAEGECEYCPICGDLMLRGFELHVDHHEPQFDALLSSFMDIYGLSFDDIDVEDLGVEVRFLDRELATVWQTYHADKAVLRLTHKLCNLTRGKQ